MPLKTVGNIRRKFNIKGKEWRVHYVRNLHSDEHGPCLGDCDPVSRIIKIETQQSAESKWRTFVHELFHAIHYEVHATEAGGVDGLLGELLAEGATDVILSLFTLDWQGTRASKKKMWR